MQLTDSETRNICKEKLESLEHWLRRLIDEKLTKAYGDFFGYQDSNGNRIIRRKITESIEDRLNKEPERYSRKVDAILLDDAIDIICNPNLYNNHFREALVEAFPDGQSVARTVMKRLSDPRNRLAHANPISLRQYEQVVCYTGDIIESIKKHYSSRSMEEEYNVPLILKVIDSFGNAFHRNQFQNVHDGGIMKNLSEDSRYYLRPGDTLTLEVEVDPSFSEEEYEISWASPKGFGNAVPNGKKAVIEITDSQVAKMYGIQCRVTSNKSWHRMHLGADDFLIYALRVLPPI
ncbi:MAG: hypothetical protein RPU59_12215 [Candidatus Sedimenticola sp. (ex Thyasira tokunagai)]